MQVPFCTIIDQNEFNGLSYLEKYQPSQDEKDQKIKQIVDEKILDCLQAQKEEINLSILIIVIMPIIKFLITNLINKKQFCIIKARTNQERKAWQNFFIKGRFIMKCTSYKIKIALFFEPN